MRHVGLRLCVSWRDSHQTQQAPARSLKPHPGRFRKPPCRCLTDLSCAAADAC
jgi:hypothetical protein